MTTLSQNDLDRMLQHIRSTATITARFLRPLAGGQPAGDKGLAAFVEHWLKISPDSPEFQQAIDRIKNEEIGERETTPEAGEVQTETVYAVNVIRRGEHGPYVAEHQIKAMLKQAASRLGLFTAKKGSKGDVAEMGTVTAAGDSLQDPKRPWEIHLRKGGRAAATEFHSISGSVGTPSGKKSIQHHTEVCEEGAEFCFKIEWPAKKLTATDMALVIAAASKIKLGSCLSLGYGLFEVMSMEIDD